jgi:hypothetical protein
MEKKITYEDGTFTIALKVPRKMRGKYTYDDGEWEQDAVCVFIDNSREEYGLFHTQYLDYKDSLQATSPIIFFDSQKEAEEFAAKYRLMIEYGHGHTLEESLQDNK